MFTFISMLRGINVGGKKRIRMPDLQKLYESLGLVNVTTYIQSGNVVFDFDGEDAGQLSTKIETEITRFFGFPVPVLIRDKPRLGKVLDGNPFINQRKEDPAKLHVTFLSESPTILKLNGLSTPKDIVDEFSISGSEIYLFCPNGYGNTKLNNTFFEKKLGVFATTRNWNTVRTLVEMANQG
jgi:uncharacterized protein (DUF1697 family)